MSVLQTKGQQSDLSYQGHRLISGTSGITPKAIRVTKSQVDCGREFKAEPAGRAWSLGLRKGSDPPTPAKGLPFLLLTVKVCSLLRGLREVA